MPTLSGNVKDYSGGSNVARVLRIYRLSDGEYFGDTLSDAVTGNWSKDVPDYTEYFVIRHDAQRGANYSSRVLGLHCTGFDGTKDFIEVTGKKVTTIGSIAISTSQHPAVSGVLSSAYANGSASLLSIEDSTDFDFGTGDLTIKGRFLFSSHSTIQTLIGNYKDSTTGFALQCRSDTNTIRLTNGDAALIDVSWTPSNNVWYEIEASRHAGLLRIRVDGTTVGSPVANTTNISGSTNPMLVGGLYLASFIQSFNGYFSEIEIHNECINLTDYTVSSDQFQHAIGNLISDNALTYDRLIPI